MRHPTSATPDTAVKPRVTTRRPRQYKVILHNDDYTTMEFVIVVLMRFFAKSIHQATEQMFEVHTQGSTIAGVFPKEIAETKAQETAQAAEQAGMPLLVTCEPEVEEHNDRSTPSDAS